MMRFNIPAVALAVLLMTGTLGAPALASDHLDFHRQQCNGGKAVLAAKARGCSKVADSDRFGAAAKGIAYYDMGVAYGLNGQFNKAVENYTKALKLNPRDSDAAFNRDLALRAMKELGKEGELLTKSERSICRREDECMARCMLCV